MKEDTKADLMSEDSSSRANLVTAPMPSFKPSYTSHYDEESWMISVTLPGVSKSDLSVTLENERLEISAIRRTDLSESWKALSDYPESRRYILKLDVGPEVDPAGISAVLEDGVLLLRLPLREETKPLKIEVK